MNAVRVAQDQRLVLETEFCYNHRAKLFNESVRPKSSRSGGRMKMKGLRQWQMFR